MAIRKIFASIEHPEKYGYVYDSDRYESSYGRYNLEPKFRMYETYGDRLVQHSNDYPIHVEYLTDYLFSLAAFLLAEGIGDDDDRQLWSEVQYRVNRRPTDADIAFAASVVWKEPEENKPYPKTRYYSVREHKITTNAEKRHDKRYQEVSRSDDGSVKAIKRMLIPEYADGLEHYCYASAIRDWCQAGTNSEHRPWADLPATQLEWFGGDHHKARELKDAYEAIREVVEGFRMQYSGSRSVKYYRDRMEQRAKAKADAEAAETAKDIDAVQAELEAEGAAERELNEA